MIPTMQKLKIAAKIILGIILLAMAAIMFKGPSKAVLESTQQEARALALKREFKINIEKHYQQLKYLYLNKKWSQAWKEAKKFADAKRLDYMDVSLIINKIKQGYRQYLLNELKNGGDDNGSTEETGLICSKLKELGMDANSSGIAGRCSIPLTDMPGPANTASTDKSRCNY